MDLSFCHKLVPLISGIIFFSLGEGSPQFSQKSKYTLISTPHWHLGNEAVLLPH
jgi:hypothetical protein